MIIYKQVPASKHLQRFVKSYWMIDGLNDKTIRKEKIIPDGYLEMVFHYKEPYKSNINGSWRDKRDKYVIAGQISNHFYLENIGYTGMFGIKFQPWAFRTLFNIDMKSITDDNIQIPDNIMKEIKPLNSILDKKLAFETKVAESEKWLTDLLQTNKATVKKGESAAKMMLETNGALGLTEIKDKTNISERALQRYFKEYIGLSPKFYCRIIRFSHIFKLASSENPNWTDIALQAGFYDQAHFIKDFKEFTGEEPSKYGFDESNAANLFLRPVP
jgi:AraC-like DNA-binding protein